jgi:hypothetical protein
VDPRVPESILNDRSPSAFGFRVRSTLALRFTRAGGGAEPLEVVLAPTAEPTPPPDGTLVSEWTMAGATGDVQAALYRVEGGFRYRASDVGTYRIDPAAGRIVVPPCDDGIVREQRLWGIPSTLCYMQRGDLSLHAAAVEVPAGAVVLAGPGRYGKTTLALAFHRYGFRVLSEDLTCCRARGEAPPAILPGPALLRVRPDIYDGQGPPPPGTHVVLARPDRIYLGFDDDRKGGTDPVPIAAVVFLRESAGELRLERIPAPVAIADLWALNFRLPTSEGRARSFQHLTQLAASLPTWNLYRPMSLAVLEETVEKIVRHAAGSAG